MFALVQKQKSTQQGKPASATLYGRAHSGQGREMRSILHLQRTIGNQAVQRLLQADAEECEDGSLTGASPRFAHDFSRIPVHANARSNIQPKVNDPGGVYEREAGRWVEQVMRMLHRTSEVIPDTQAQINSMRGGGQPLPEATSPSFEPSLDRDFSRVLLPTGGRGSFAAFALNPKSRGYGEEPKPEEPTPKNGTESPSSPPQAGCGCSNLRLGEDRYEGARKKVKFLFDVEPGKDPHQCVLVQQVIGEKYLLSIDTPAKKTHPLSIPILGENKPFNYPNWEIDSTDKDPVLSSNSKSRWNYRSEGEHTFYATDSPSHIEPYQFDLTRAVSAAKFKTGLYCASQVPTTLTAASQLRAPLQEVEWEDSTCWEYGKEPTHPGFGKECVWSAAKPGE